MFFRLSVHILTVYIIYVATANTGSSDEESNDNVDVIDTDSGSGADETFNVQVHVDVHTDDKSALKKKKRNKELLTSFIKNMTKKSKNELKLSNIGKNKTLQVDVDKALKGSSSNAIKGDEEDSVSCNGDECLNIDEKQQKISGNEKIKDGFSNDDDLMEENKDNIFNYKTNEAVNLTESNRNKDKVSVSNKNNTSSDKLDKILNIIIHEQKRGKKKNSNKKSKKMKRKNQNKTFKVEDETSLENKTNGIEHQDVRNSLEEKNKSKPTTKELKFLNALVEHRLKFQNKTETKKPKQVQNKNLTEKSTIGESSGFGADAEEDEKGEEEEETGEEDDANDSNINQNKPSTMTGKTLTITFQESADKLGNKENNDLQTLPGLTTLTGEDKSNGKLKEENEISKEILKEDQNNEKLKEVNKECTKLDKHSEEFHLLKNNELLRPAKLFNDTTFEKAAKMSNNKNDMKKNNSDTKADKRNVQINQTNNFVIKQSSLANQNSSLDAYDQNDFNVDVDDGNSGLSRDITEDVYLINSNINGDNKVEWSSKENIFEQNVMPKRNLIISNVKTTKLRKRRRRRRRRRSMKDYLLELGSEVKKPVNAYRRNFKENLTDFDIKKITETELSSQSKNKRLPEFWKDDSNALNEYLFKRDAIYSLVSGSGSGDIEETEYSVDKFINHHSNKTLFQNDTVETGRRRNNPQQTWFHDVNTELDVEEIQDNDFGSGKSSIEDPLTEIIPKKVRIQKRDSVLDQLKPDYREPVMIRKMAIPGVYVENTAGINEISKHNKNNDSKISKKSVQESKRKSKIRNKRYVSDKMRNNRRRASKYITRDKKLHINGSKTVPGDKRLSIPLYTPSLFEDSDRPAIVEALYKHDTESNTKTAPVFDNKIDHWSPNDVQNTKLMLNSRDTTWTSPLSFLDSPIMTGGSNNMDNNSDNTPMNMENKLFKGQTDTISRKEEKEVQDEILKFQNKMINKKKMEEREYGNNNKLFYGVFTPKNFDDETSDKTMGVFKRMLKTHQEGHSPYKVLPGVMENKRLGNKLEEKLLKEEQEGNKLLPNKGETNKMNEKLNNDRVMLAEQRFRQMELARSQNELLSRNQNLENIKQAKEQQTSKQNLNTGKILANSVQQFFKTISNDTDLLDDNEKWISKRNIDVTNELRHMLGYNKNSLSANINTIIKRFINARDDFKEKSEKKTDNDVVSENVALSNVSSIPRLTTEKLDRKINRDFSGETVDTDMLVNNLKKRTEPERGDVVFDEGVNNSKRYQVFTGKEFEDTKENKNKEKRNKFTKKSDKANIKDNISKQNNEKRVVKKKEIKLKVYKENENNKRDHFKNEDVYNDVISGYAEPKNDDLIDNSLVTEEKENNNREESEQTNVKRKLENKVEGIKQNENGDENEEGKPFVHTNGDAIYQFSILKKENRRTQNDLHSHQVKRSKTKREVSNSFSKNSTT